MRTTISALVGFVFAIGLGISGMTLPERVIGFLDVTGDWDPALAFVMGGAVMVYGLGYALVPRLRRPFAADRFQLPTRRDISPRLLLGATLFGAGWGLGGLCPGPALVSLAGGGLAIVVFVIAMTTGMYGHHLLARVRA
jgi:uncharacterized protein